MDGTLKLLCGNINLGRKKKKRHVKFCYFQSVYEKIGHQKEKK